MGLFGKRKEQIPPQPTVEEKAEELRPLNELTELERAEKDTKIKWDLYVFRDKELGRDPDNKILQDERNQAYMSWKIAEDKFKELQQN